jgi:hypothetical protein
MGILWGVHFRREAGDSIARTPEHLRRWRKKAYDCRAYSDGGEEETRSNGGFFV